MTLLLWGCRTLIRLILWVQTSINWADLTGRRPLWGLRDHFCSLEVMCRGIKCWIGPSALRESCCHNQSIWKILEHHYDKLEDELDRWIGVGSAGMLRCIYQPPPHPSSRSQKCGLIRIRAERKTSNWDYSWIHSSFSNSFSSRRKTPCIFYDPVSSQHSGSLRWTAVVLAFTQRYSTLKHTMTTHSVSLQH